MPVRVLGMEGEVTDSVTTANGLRYAAAEGAQVVTMSFGSPEESLAITDAIADHPEALFVASAGNADFDTAFLPRFPCNSDPPNIICVASSDENDQLAPGSSYGPTTVDLAAPGSQIVGPNGDPATRGPGAFVSRSGSSLAVPHVAGIAALIKSLEPWHGPLAQKGCILDGVDRSGGLEGRVISGGRANALRALQGCADRGRPDLAPVQIAPADGALVRPDAFSFRFTPGRDSLSGVAANLVMLDGRPLVSGGPAAATLSPPRRVGDGRHVWAVRSTDRFGNYRESGGRAVLVDGTAPRMGLRIRRRSAARGIRAAARLSEAVTVGRVEVRLSRKVAREIRSRKRTLRAKATKTLAAGTRTLSVALPRAVRRRGARQRIRLRIRFSDRAGNGATKSLSVKLR
jgi:hypothetical protein